MTANAPPKGSACVFSQTMATTNQKTRDRGTKMWGKKGRWQQMKQMKRETRASENDSLRGEGCRAGGIK